MKKTILLLIISFATLWVNQASALSLENFDSLRKEDPEQLMYYLAGVRDGVTWTNTITSNPIYCPSKNTSFDIQEVIKIIDATVKTNNTNRDSPVEMLLIFGLQELYPCQ